MSNSLTIITITSRDPSGFARTARSLRGQSTQSFNWIIKCDRQSQSYVLKYSSFHPSASVVSSSDLGIYDAMNQAIDSCSTNPAWTLFLNGGDELFSCSTIKSLLSFIQVQSFSLLSDIIICGSTRYVISPRFSYLQPSRLVEDCLGIYSYRIPTSHQSMVFSPSIIKRFRYSTSFLICGDGEFFWRCIFNGATPVYTKLTLSRFHFGGKSLYYPGLLKQREVYKFITSTRRQPFYITLIAVLFSILTTISQRISFWCFNHSFSRFL